MNKFYYYHIILAICTISLASCVTTRKSKQEVGFIGKKFHDLTARYNGYFNAKELYKKNIQVIEDQHVDNYSRLIPIYTYDAEFDRSIVEEDMDKAIEKSTKVAALHEPSKWVDDCYVMMGKAQYLKGDLETAQETFEYFVEDFNPRDPDSRVYITPNVKESSKDRRKAADDARKIQQEEREQARKEKEEERKNKKKEREKKAKDRKRSRGAKKKVEDAKDKIAETKEKLTDMVGNTKPPENDVVASTSEVAFDPDEEYVASFENKPESSKPTELQDNNGGLFKHKPAYQEGIYWLARTYIARELWLEANYFLDKLEKEENLNKNLKELTIIARADYFLGQKDMINAIPALRKAIDESSDKELKARMAFILAQCYQLKGQSAEAYAAFEEVQDYKPSFELKLNAELNQIKNAWTSGNKSEDSAINQLEKMAKEGKYVANRGSIYSTMAEIKLASGDQEAALEYFNKALESGGANDKTEIYYRLATLFYTKDQYVEAKNYFDSTAAVMSQKDSRLTEVQTKAKSLDGIAKNINIVKAKDSLLMLVAMSDDELNSYAEKIAKQLLEEKIANEKAAATEGGFSASISVVNSNSSFFAYNEISRQKGYQDFRRKWGDRTLEDNWRRSIRSGGSSIEDEQTAEASSYSDEDLQKEINKIIRQIPRSTEDISKLNASREKAMFELGTGFRNLIQQYEKSNTTLEQFLFDYPNSEHTPEAYFYLYLNYTDLNNGVKANEYFNKLMEQYPTSDYAQYLKNPNAKDGLMTEKRKIEVYYDQTYELFTANKHEKAYDRLLKSADMFPENHMIAKYELLKAMTIGKLKGQDEYVNALRGVILKYNNTPEQTYAKELMRFLKGDGQAFEGDVTEGDMSKFAFEDDRMHYIVMIVYDSNSGQVDEIEKLIEKYNETNFPEKRLRQASISLNKEVNSHLILIRRFNNKDDSMIYYNKVTKAGNQYVSTSTYSYELFAISQRNYREVIQQKNANTYREFFETNYLSDSK